MDYGANIKAARKSAGLTQKQLAERLGISSVNISQLENNQRIPNMSTLERIAEALNIHAFDLTGIGKELDGFSVKIVTSKKDGSQLSPTEQAEQDRIFAGGARAIYDDLPDDVKAEFWAKIISPLHAQLDDAFEKLNEEGQQKAIERVEELTEIPRYRASAASESTPPSPEGQSTTPPPDAPETPSEGD